MNKKVIRNMLLLLIIPTLICMLISVIHVRDNSFSTTVCYDDNGKIIEKTENINNNSSNTNDENLYMVKEPNLDFLMTAGIVSVIIFIFFYYAVTKRKGW